MFPNASSENLLFRSLTVVVTVLAQACSTTSAGPNYSRSTHRDASEPPAPLTFSITEGEISNHFYRDQIAAAHLVLRSGKRPRWIVAFPEGNSGIAIWFSTPEASTEFKLQSALRSVDGADGLRGIAAELAVKHPTSPFKVMLSSIRALRDYEHGKQYSRMKAPVVQRKGAAWTWSRQTLDGHRLVIKLEFIRGGFGTDATRLRLTALHDYPAMKPLAASEIFRPAWLSQISHTSQQVFAFLSYREKLLAGSWRFLTYFGRDTLLTLALMQDALTPTALETGLGSVLKRVNGQGEVAHEEEIGEYPALTGQPITPPEQVRPKYDYTMLDDDLLLPIVASKILMDETSMPPARVQRFLRQETRPGESYASQLERNMHHVLATATPYAKAPSANHLIRIQSPKGLGQWRDSKEGLGFARIPYDVNAVLMPAALRAIPTLARVLGLDEALEVQATSMLNAWSTAHQHFKVELSATAAERLALQHAKERGVPLARLNEMGRLVFHALALDSSGKPLPIMHSDVAFDLLFGVPTQANLSSHLQTLSRPFPWGLYTPVGVLVANPAFADNSELRALFTQHHYQGEVFWPWQHALIVAGLGRQRQQHHLPHENTQHISDLCTRLRSEVLSDRSITELSTWTYDPKHGYRHQPFQRQSDVTESNAAQLWSVATEAYRHGCR